MDKDQKRGCLVLVFLMLVFGVWFGSCMYNAGEEIDKTPIEKQDNRVEALVYMQSYVKDQLKAPGTAKFPGSTDPDTQVLKSGTKYTVMSWVDSQNSFGALIRSPYVGSVRQVAPDEWELVELVFPE